jgi:MFS family permease
VPDGRKDGFIVRRPLLLAAAALSSVLLLSWAHWNFTHLVVLQEHPLPSLIFWPAIWVLLGSAVTLLIPSHHRGRATTVLVFGATGLAVLFAGGVALVAGIIIGSSSRGDLVDRASSADGRYEVRVLHWHAVLGEDGWDIVIRRTDGVRFVDAFAGCLFSETGGGYDSIRSVEPGSVRITTAEGPIAITFDPATMHVTRRVPSDLCGGYE